MKNFLTGVLTGRRPGNGWLVGDMAMASRERRPITSASLGLSVLCDPWQNQVAVQSHCPGSLILDLKAVSPHEHPGAIDKEFNSYGESNQEPRKKFEQQTTETNKKFDALMNVLREMKEAHISQNDNNKSSGEFSRETNTGGPIHNKTHHGYVPKLELPRFDGSNPRL
ncbi:hypothetical protein AgCh_012006 [Apium graveolens]